MRKENAQIRFNRLFEPVTESGCWIWMSGTDAGGYGMFWADGASTRAHRASWKLHRGLIPRGLFVLHRCDVTSCVNPNHLFLGSKQDNLDDMVAKGRDRFSVNPARGERNGHAKFTEEQVKLIRVDQRSQVEIAREHNVNRSQISRIKAGKRWRHLGD